MSDKNQNKNLITANNKNREYIFKRTLCDYKLEVSKSNNVVDSLEEIIPLSPRADLSDDKHYQVYASQLKLALRHKDVYNIALTGVYGSGKSSILATFKNQYQYYNSLNFIDISLATFDEGLISQDKKNNPRKDTHTNEDNEPIKELDDTAIQLIEKSILQQLIYSVSQEEIPLSSFKRISKTNIRELFGLICILIWSSIFVLFPDNFIAQRLDFQNFHYTLCLIYLFIFGAIVLWKLLNYGLNLKEIKFKLHDAEFNIKNDDNKSILNEHIDEIIYFFESTKKNVVIIEDLDRFKNTEIFIRLRELNFLINKSCSHQVRFIYAIRDDMFKDSQRSKFFEYIIPVIPIITPDNAYDLIKGNKLYTAITKNLSEKFLRKICLYFDDMRLLLNILTEYQTYAKHLDNLRFDHDKLFALIVYKNYSPKQFSKLYTHDGEIFHLFNSKKQETIIKVQADFQHKIQTLRNAIINSRSETQSTVEDLNRQYAYELLQRIPSSFSSHNHYSNNIQLKISIDSQHINKSELNKTDTLKMLANGKTLNIQYTNTRSNININFIDVQNQVSNKPYLERLDLIENKSSGKIKQLEDDILQLEEELGQISLMTLQELANLHPIDTESKMLKFCIANGYIDKTYVEYISYFFESSLTKKDKDFVMLLNSRDEPNFELELQNHRTLLENDIYAEEMLLTASLNFSLMDYLLTNDEFDDHKNNYIANVVETSFKANDFIKAYFERGMNLDKFIPLIIKTNKNVFDSLVIDFYTSETEKNMRNIIRYTPLDLLKNSNYLIDLFDRFLDISKNYIPFLLDCFDNSEDPMIRFKRFSDIIKPKLDLLEIDKSNTQHLELFNWLGANNYLYTSYKVIHKIVYYNSDTTEEETTKVLAEKPLTTIMNSDIEYLKNDIQISDEHIDKILQANSNNTFKEDEDILIEFLNGSIDNHRKIQLIEKSETKIDDITKIEDTDLHETIFNKNKIKPVWKNVIQIYQNHENELPEYLINYLNNHYVELNQDNGFHKENSNLNEDLQKDFELTIIACDLLIDDAYTNIIETLFYKWKYPSINNLSEKKVSSLIKYNRLGFYPQGWNNIKELNNNKLRNQFLEFYLKKILTQENNEFQFELSDYETLLSANAFKSERQSFAEKHCETLIQNSENLTSIIISLFDNKEMPTNLYNQVLEYSNTEQKIKLLHKQIQFMTPESIFECINQMAEPFNQLAVIQDDEIKFENNKQNQDFLQLLQDKGLIKKILSKRKNKIGKKYLFTRRRKDV